MIKGNSLVVLTAHLQFIVISNLSEARPKTFPDLHLDEAPGCWDILTAECSLSKHVEIYVAVKQTIVTVDPANVQDQVQ